MATGNENEETTARNNSSLAVKSIKNDRAVTKKGVCNFTTKNVKQKRLKYISDFATTFLDLQWRWVLLGFTFVYFASWFAFAVLWYLILWFHGDIEHYGEDDWSPCVTNIQNFTSAFIFSAETQHTTGYGIHELRELCSSAVLLFCVQSIVGIMIEGIMCGLVFLKISRGKRRSETIIFSKNGVISVRDGILCFMFRIADMRNKTHLLEAQVRALLIRNKITAEEEAIPEYRQELSVGGDGEKDNNVLLFWPTCVIHKITESSTLYGLKEEEERRRRV